MGVSLGRREPTEAPAFAGVWVGGEVTVATMSAAS